MVARRITWRTALLGIPFGVALIVGWLLANDLSRQQEQAKLVEHTYQFLGASNAFLSLIQDAETGQRGYLLTSEDSYLEPYLAAVRNVGAAKETLLRLARANSASPQRLAELEQLTDAKLSELNQTVELHRGGNRQAAREIVETDRGQELMQRIRELVSSIQAEEHDHLARHEAESERSAFQARLIAILGGTLLLILLVIATAVIDRDAVVRLEQEALLRTSEERFRIMANSAGVLVWTSGTDRLRTWFNLPWLEFTGHTLEEELGDGWTRGVHPADLDGYLEAYSKAFDQRKPLMMEYRMRRSDGNYRWIVDHGAPLLASGGAFLGYVGSCIDIDDRKRDADRLRAANEELLRINADLEQFAYSASHDLKEPLRNVAIFSELVHKRFGDRIGDQGKGFLDHIVTGVRRMETLLSGLLNYLQLSGAAAEGTGATDANDVFRSVLLNLKTAIEDRSARITSDKLPTVAIPEVHLAQVFQNLIGNALKYSGREAPNVHVSSNANGASCRFSVSDDGIGIDPQYQKTIFSLFKRLHTNDSIPGAGMGLAISQRIVERYGGRIWVESQLGRGSTFHFTVPPGREPADGEQSEAHAHFADRR